jgi:hypothetical protein
LDSILLSPFETEGSLEQVLSLAFTSQSPVVSAKAFSVVYELISQFESYEDPSQSSDPLFENVFRLVLSKLSDICQFVLGADRFLEKHACALDLVCSIAARSGPIPAPVVSLAIGLTGKLFEQSVNSAFHIRFSCLIGRIARSPAQFSLLCHDTTIRARIMAAFAKRKEVHASYWGALHHFAKTIAATAEPTDENADWNAFVQGTIEPMTTAISEGFGGHRPLPGEIPPDDDCIFPVGRSEQARRFPSKPAMAAALFSRGTRRDEEEDEIEEDELERQPT